MFEPGVKMGRLGSAFFWGTCLSVVSSVGMADPATATAPVAKSAPAAVNKPGAGAPPPAIVRSPVVRAKTSSDADDEDDSDAADDVDSAVKIVLPPGRQEMLDANNALRAELGLSPFVWSRHLSHAARLWAKHLAVDVHSLVHSHTDGMGENLAMWSSGYKTPAGLVGLWADEKAFFLHAQFPSVSKTGNWLAVAHYSQIVWRNTTKVGCGIATDDKSDYLVCEYSPQGNVIGEPVY
jgi:hypothetical protein